MAVVAQSFAQTRKDLSNLIGVEMVKEAIDQNEVEPIPRDRVSVKYIGGYKGAPVTASGVLDVALVHVDPKIAGVGEVLGVCSRAASDVEHSTDGAQVVVR